MEGWIRGVRQVVGRLWPRRKGRPRLEALAERVRSVEMKLEELEAAVKASQAQEMSEVAAGDWPLREELQGAGVDTDVPGRSGAHTEERWGSQAAWTTDRVEIESAAALSTDGGGSDAKEMLHKAHGGSGAEAQEGLVGDAGAADVQPVDVRRGMPQGIPGQQTRRKAARLWEGVL